MDGWTRRSCLLTGASAAVLWAFPPWGAVNRTFRATGAQRFQIDAGVETPDQPLSANRFIQHEKPMGFVHCAAICEHREGRLSCVWYAGSREGAQDQSIWISHLDPDGNSISEFGSATDSFEPIGGTWSIPVEAIDRRRVERELSRQVRKIGNPVLFRDSEQRLWLVFVSIGVGGWSGSSLNACCSVDGGQTWEPIQQLALSPFFNVSHLVRNAPVYLESGDILLPVYHECLGVFPELLWIRPLEKGLAVHKTRMAGGRSFLQPSVVPTSPTRAIAYLRDASGTHRVAYQITVDGGRQWTRPQFLSLPNPNADVAAVGLANGSVLMACNPSTTYRDSLALFVSPDGVGDWQMLTILDQQQGGQFAYPYMIRSADGTIHLVYSWNLSRIRHLAFNEAWIDQQREHVAIRST